MQLDFHYYATYCAAFLAGYSHEESLEIAYSAQFTDCCSRTLLKKLKGPAKAATTQIQTELLDEDTNIFGLQNITRIWASFHFLPKDLYVNKPHRPKIYMNKYRLICGPNGDLAVETVKLAKGGHTQAVGIAMHVLADTWAHSNFAGTPTYVINNTNSHFYELVNENGEETERKINFRHNPSKPDNPEEGIYSNSVRQASEISVMNLGHGRAGHLPDYSYARFTYMPAWKDYELITKDNPQDYYRAFWQMVRAMKYLRGVYDDFAPDTYEDCPSEPLAKAIRTIIEKRRTDASDDWKTLAERMSQREIEDFDIDKYQQEYINAKAEEKENTFLGRFFSAAIEQKNMVSHKIYESGNILAGTSKTKKNRRKQK